MKRLLSDASLACNIDLSNSLIASDLVTQESSNIGLEVVIEETTGNPGTDTTSDLLEKTFYMTMIFSSPL